MTPQDDAALIERIKALADCAYWASAGWDIPGDATQKIGRLAVKAAARLAARCDQVRDQQGEIERASALLKSWQRGYETQTIASDLHAVTRKYLAAIAAAKPE